MWILTNELQFLITYIWDAPNVMVIRTNSLVRITRKCSNHESLLEQLNNYQGGKILTQRRWCGPTTWMGRAQKCVERCCELANKKTKQFFKVSSPCLDDHHFKKEELETVGALSKVCSHIVVKCLDLARIGRPDILWLVNLLDQSHDGHKFVTDVWQD